MDFRMLMIGVIAGSIGMGYFVYGKKQAKAMPIISGIGLCVVPYFIGNIALLILVCLVLIAAPFLTEI
jgi:hypothetical protein